MQQNPSIIQQLYCNTENIFSSGFTNTAPQQLKPILGKKPLEIPRTILENEK